MGVEVEPMTERQGLRKVARRLRELAEAGRAEATVLREADRPARQAMSRMRNPARRLYTRLTGRLPANRIYGRLHTATESLADLASEVSAYADLLEEKAGRLESWHRRRTEELLDHERVGSPGETGANRPENRSLRPFQS